MDNLIGGWGGGGGGAGSFQQPNCPIREALPCSQLALFSPTISSKHVRAWMFQSIYTNPTTIIKIIIIIIIITTKTSTRFAPHTYTPPLPASFHRAVSHLPLCVFEKQKVPVLANLSIRMLSCCGDDGGPWRPTIHLQRLAT